MYTLGSWSTQKEIKKERKYKLISSEFYVLCERPCQRKGYDGSGVGDVK